MFTGRRLAVSVATHTVARTATCAPSLAARAVGVAAPSRWLSIAADSSPTESLGWIVKPRFNYKHIRDNATAINANIANRKCAGDAVKVGDMYTRLVQLQFDHNALRHQQKQLSSEKIDLEQRKARGSALKAQLDVLAKEITALEDALLIEASMLPCDSHPDSPIGTEDKAVTVRDIGQKKQFSFKPRDHAELLTMLDWADFAGTASLAGAKFVTLRREAVLLELALIQFAMSRAMAAGFVPLAPPDLAHRGVVAGCGFRPRGDNSQVYDIHDTELSLIGTSEISVAGMFANRMVNPSDLPARFVAVSHCFRREAGAGGQASKGLYRLHQFTKVELFSFTRPEDSAAEFEKLTNLQQSLYEELGLAARVLNMPTAELGASAHRKYDIEAWMPGREAYGEITSASECLDYQSRRLNIRFKDEGAADSTFVHTLNATACAVPRVLLTIMETYQQEDGSVEIPAALQPFCNMKVVRPRNAV